MRKKRSRFSGQWPLGLRKAADVLRDVVYPEGAVCQGCGKISDGRCLCPACREELRHSGMLYAWERKDLEGVAAWSLRGHSGLPRRLILRLKYQANACIAAELAEILLPLPAELTIPPETIVTWVPMPKRRRMERCVDHGQLLAEATARQLRLLCRPLLARQDRDAHTQEGLSRERRIRNLKRAYMPLQRISFPVLLVDDVLTTGTTARRCIAALREAGAKDITVLTYTHATNLL